MNADIPVFAKDNLGPIAVYPRPQEWPEQKGVKRMFKKKWAVKACMKKDYHYGPPREYAYTRLGAWIKARKYRHYDLVKIEKL